MHETQRIIWLASYPKSGNTWMRSLLARYFMPEGQAPNINNLRQFTTGDTRRDFYAAAAGGTYANKSVEEWLNIRPQVLRRIALSRPNYHFVKTHCQATKYKGRDLITPEVTAAAIYIMRNPFDVTLSYARHLSLSIDDTIDVLCDSEMVMGHPEIGIYDAIGRWDSHVRSWVHAPGLPNHIMRYEDLLSNPTNAMNNLLENFLKSKVDRKKLKKAISASSFEALKKQEEELGFTEKPTGMASFFAKGEAGAWREELTPEQVGRIREEFLEILEEWYPELINQTAEFIAES